MMLSDSGLLFLGGGIVPGTAAVRRRRHRYGLKPRPAAKLTVPNR